MGYWFHGAHAGWSPPRELVRFLDAGPPPVYVGFGSMVVGQAEVTAKAVCRAFQETGQRGILTGILAAAAGPRPGGGVFSIDSVPHDWLLPRVAAAVHHDGAGTTAACLRAGIPSLVVPIVADQFFWGERIRALGAGPVPFPLTRLTAERLVPAIRQCVSSAGMRGRAAEIGRAIRAEDGVARAVEELTAILERSAAAVADRYSTT
jgi:sterol 3beta-glucosyltransferase